MPWSARFLDPSLNCRGTLGEQSPATLGARFRGGKLVISSARVASWLGLLGLCFFGHF